MNVAPKYTNNRIAQLKPKNTVAVDTKVEAMPTVELPLGLKILLFFQRSSTVVTIGLIGITTIVYAQTNYTPQQWTEQYRKLIMLQSAERNLVATDESIKNQIAEEAEKKETGLVNPLPSSVLFLPSPTGLQKLPPNKSQNTSTNNALNLNPQGY